MRSRVHPILGGLKQQTTSLRSGELAKRTGVSTDTLRHYERLGLLKHPPRTGAGYRLYPLEAAERVQLIRRALSIGFTLGELSPILRVRDHGGIPCKQVRTLAASKLQDLDQRIKELIQMRKQLRNLLAKWDERLQTVSEGQRAGLLEMLPNSVERPPQKGKRI